MDSSHAMMRSTSFVTKVFPTVFFLFLLSSSLFVDPAVGFTVTGGIVEHVSGPVVTVQGKSYDTGGARIMAPSGKELPPSELVRGIKVDLHMVNGKIAAVIIYPSMVE
ncbi:MAG: hypothetical protein AABY98_08610 [Candidatus Deferrimicrobiota bacterium]